MPPKRRSTSPKRTTRTRTASRQARSRTPRPKKGNASPKPKRTTSPRPKAKATPEPAVSPPPSPPLTAAAAPAPPRGRDSPLRSLRLANKVARSPSPPTAATGRDVPTLMKPQRYRLPEAVHGNANASGSGGSASKLVILGQMLSCVAGIYFCFSMWSLKQERLMTMPYGNEKELFPTVFGVSLVQHIAGSLVAVLIIASRPLVSAVSSHFLNRPGTLANQPKGETLSDIVSGLTSADVRAMTVVGFATAFGATLGYAAMRRLSFPVVLATKMSKMVPVMVVGFLVYGTRYSWQKVMSCAMITIGILTFYLMEDSSGKAASSSSKSHGGTPDGGGDYAWIGFVLLFANLFLDGFANSTQDVLVRRHGWASTTLMLCSNVSSAVWALAVMLALECQPLQQLASTVLPDSLMTHFAFGDLSNTLHFLQNHPDALQDLIAMSLLNAVGQIFIYQTITLFGTLTLTAMTLVRKAGSVLLSIFVNGHSVSPPQWAALGLVMVSVVFEAHVNITETAEKRKRQQQASQRRHAKTE